MKRGKKMGDNFVCRYCGKAKLMIEVEAGSPAALAEPEKIRDHFLQKGAVREIERAEYARLTRIYSSHAGEGEKDE